MEITLFKKKGIKYEKVERGLNFHPHHAWKVVFGTFLTVLVLVLAFSIYLFWQSLHADIHDTGMDQTPILPKVDKAELEKISKYYQDKQTTYDTMHAQSPEIVDPGI